MIHMQEKQEQSVTIFNIPILFMIHMQEKQQQSVTIFSIIVLARIEKQEQALCTDVTY